MFQEAPRHPILVTASVMLASLLYSIDWTIAAVALPHMQGTFSATQDQIGWVITSYIVASAISIPTAGWLSTRFGRKRVFVAALSAFTVASVFCGAAESLAVEVPARVIQGLGGAFLIPLSHAIILDNYPPEQHAKAMALWGLGSVTGSFIGPTLGGYLTEYLSWHYVFYINVPFGVLSLVGIVLFVPETRRNPSHPLDWTGFLTLALAIGSFQLMLDRGGQLDWFESPEIVIEACLSTLGMYLFVAHSMTSRAPFLDVKLIVQRHFFLGLCFVFLYGLLTIPPIVLMPPFLQDIQGYPVDTIGLLQAPRGLGMIGAMMLSGRLTERLDPRLMIGAGLLCLAWAAAEMSTWNAAVGTWPLVWTNLVQGIGGGIIMVPIQSIAFPGVPPERRTEAAAVFNLVRSIGASIGVSTALALFVRQSGATRSRLAEQITDYNQALRLDGQHGGWSLHTLKDIASLDRMVDVEAAMISYTMDFRLLAFAALGGLVFLLFVGRTRRPAGGAMEATEAA
ncbi:MAG: DHA2 family efflux MFS transporter permease subunit [Burkholderiales bacterium]